MFESPATSVYNCNIDQRSRYREIAHRSSQNREQQSSELPKADRADARRISPAPRPVHRDRQSGDEVTHAANATVEGGSRSHRI